MSKSFWLLIALAVVLGVGLGGAFIGGVAFGKTQNDATANVQGVAAFGPGGLPAAGFAGRNQPVGFQQSPSGASPGSQSDAGTNLASPVQRGGQCSGDGAAARSGLMGMVETIEGNTVTINTPQGTVQTTISEDTAITRVVEAAPEDLQVGDQVRVMGDETEDDGVAAKSITIIPEGNAGFPMRGFSGERGPQLGHRAP